MKYNIGDQVWVVVTKQIEKRITCPECMGKRYATIILGNGTHVTVECGNCCHGYEGSNGIILTYEFETFSELQTINKIEQIYDRYEYGTDKQYSISSELTFSNKEDADKMTQLVKKEKEDNEENRLEYIKHDKRKSMSWNVSYHRKCIRQAKKDLEYHTKKLDAALIKAKLEHD